MSDLVERAMAPAAFNESTWSFETSRILREAAAELIRLRAENEAKDAEIVRLNDAIKRQAGAVRTLQACETTEINRLRKTHTEAHRANMTLDSEREMNATLTAEIEAKDKRIEALLLTLNDAIAFSNEFRKWSGPCEHEIGICVCDENRRFENWRTAAKAREDK